MDLGEPRRVFEVPEPDEVPDYIPDEEPAPELPVTEPDLVPA